MATNEQILAAIYRVIDSGKLEIKPYDDAFSCIRNMCDETGKKDVTMTAKLKGKLRKATLMAKEQGVDSFFVPSFELNKRILCWEATESFDSYMLYVEINRPREKQFYLPRRKQLKILTDAMQDLADHKIELLAISLPPGVGKASPSPPTFNLSQHQGLLKWVRSSHQVAKVLEFHSREQLSHLHRSSA